MRLAIPMVLLACWGAAAADDTPDESTRDDANRALYLEDAKQYGFARRDDDRTALRFRAEPIMKWSSDNDWSGDVFVWTHEGRPEVVGCLLSGPAAGNARMHFHEFHTLAPIALEMTRSVATKRWSPKEGVPVRPIENVPVPAKSERARLLQLRGIARSFTAKMMADEQEWTLRLLPQPLHRYSSEKAGVVDGAIFAFVWGVGTDPEMLVAIEARRDAEGRIAWTFLPIQFTNRRTTFLSRNGEELWKTDVHVEPNGDSDQPYSTFYARRTLATSTDE